MSRARTRGGTGVAAVLLVVAAGAGLAVALSDGWAGAAVAGVVAALVVFVQPLWGLLGVVFVIPFENAAMFAEGVTVTRLLGLAVTGAWLIRKLHRREPWAVVLRSPLTIALGVFITFALLSVLWAHNERPALAGAVRLVMFAALAILLMDLVRSWREVHWVVRALSLGAVVAASLTLQQYFLSGANVRRAGGDVAGGINATAFVLVSLLPLGFYLLRAGVGRWRLLGLIQVGLSITAVAVSFSRMSFLMAGALLAVEFFHALRTGWGRGPVLILGSAAVVVAAVVVPTDRILERASTILPYVDATVAPDDGGGGPPSGRGYHIRVAFAILRDNPLTGVGYGNYGYLFRERYQFQVWGAEQLYFSARSAHGTFWAFLADLGILGSALWGIVLLVGVRSLAVGWRIARQARLPPAQLLLVRALAWAFLIQGAYMTYDDVHARKSFWILLGMTTVLHSVVTAVATAGREKVRVGPGENTLEHRVPAVAGPVRSLASQP